MEKLKINLQELKALAALQKIPVTWLEDKICNPYVTVDLKRSEDAEKLVKHSMLVRSCYEIWGEGESIDKLHENLEKYI
ncbi:tRNA (guanine(10)-N2)-methyltransferase [Armadillidium vulgare]|nr:tRNA (guanine(10)-N2)-methyltransferase [Armadillidium vulgare]